MISSQEIISLPNMDNSKNLEDRRLWLGNLDPRINEYQLLKLLQKHGTIEKFDLLFHRSGPLIGQPRGYAFVTFTTKEEAVIAKESLHNLLVGSKRINVTWAHSISNEEQEKRKPNIDIPALSGTKNTNKKTSIETQIQAIEAKLKMMEGKSVVDEFEINKTVATEAPIIVQYQQNKTETTNSNNNSRHRYSNRRQHTRPYNNKHRRR